MRSKTRTIPAVSAGGIVFRRRPSGVVEDRDLEIVLVGQRRAGRWGLPKGGPNPGESMEEAALREVREETGIIGQIVATLGRIEYWFSARATRYHKVVHFYLMAEAGGDVSQHDAEHDDVRWFSLPEAYAAMSYGNEKEILRRAEAILAKS